MSFPALFLAVLAAPAPQLQPRTYVSPSGDWSLRVEPLTREGTGEADYTLSGGGREAWKARHPFALSEAAVTDDGHVAGYAYVGRPKESSSGGSLRIVVLAPTGQVRLDEAHERRASGFMHQPADPRALGLFVHPELDRLVVRVADEDLNRQAQGWWAYDLTTGAPLFRERPKVTLGLEEAIRDAPAVRAVPRTPLVLVHWYRFESAAQPRATGAAFQLLDAERRAVWRLDLPHDYEVRGDEAARDRLRLEIWERGAILEVAPARFELRHAAENQRVTYTVAQDGTGGWTVSEVARAPFDGDRPEGAPIPPYTPKLLREVALGGPPAPPGEIRDIRAFGFDPEGRLRFVREEEDGATLVQLSEAGEVRRVAPVSLELDADQHLDWFPLASPRWIAVAQSYQEGARARAWRVDEDTGTAVEVPGFPGEDVKRVTELPDGRLIVLGTALSTLEPGGAAPWTVAEDYEDPSKLFAAEDFAVTSAGKVVVLDNIRNTLQVFTDEGRYLETIDLTACWGKEPNYPSSIVADSEGGVLVHDSGGRPPLVRMTLDGLVRASLDPRMANGQAREEYRRAVRFAPDGRMWTTDGHEFVRLDEQGIVDLQLGQPARIESIESPGHAVIDSTFGRLLILDDRTRALHVFDAEGRRVALCRPRPEELDALRLPLRMMCDSSGGALAADSRHSRKHLRFTADGASRGSEKLEGVNVAFVPGRDAYWSVVKSAPALIGASGEQERAIPRLADGSWWRSIEDLSVAVDGTLVVLDLPGTSDGITRRPGAGLVARFDAEGRPLGEHALPNGVSPAQVSHAGPWVLLSYYSDQAFLIDTREGNLRALRLPAEMGSEAERAWGLAPSGDELWVLEAKARRLLRFALPD